MIESDPVTYQCVQAILKSLECEYADNLLIAIKANEGELFAKAVQHPVIPEWCEETLDSDIDLFRREYLAYNLVRKFQGFEFRTLSQRQAVCWEKWKNAEESCLLVNDLGRTYSQIDGHKLPLELVIQRARAYINQVLGPYSIDKWMGRCSFSGGSTTSRKRQNGHPLLKYTSIGRNNVTRKALPYAVTAIKGNQNWFYSYLCKYGPDPRDWFTVVNEGRGFSVPKDWGTERPCEKQSDMNVYLQKGVGSYIRDQLKNFRVNLNSQWLNQHYAMIGSATGSLCTIDLSNASGSIAIGLVRDLVHPEWFDVLCQLRTEVAILPDGSVHELEQFSGMGNGFTFELESLIFWALTRACQDCTTDLEDRRLAIFGDDIVVHHSVAPLLYSVFKYVGFTVNATKSYTTGGFRESCGKHYLFGRDVTPFFIKESLDDEVAYLYHCYNSMHIWSGGRHAALEPILRHIPGSRRNYVPRRFGLMAGIFNGDVCRRTRRLGKARKLTERGWVENCWEFTVRQKRGSFHEVGGWAGLFYALSLSKNGDEADPIRIGLESEGQWSYVKITDPNLT